MKNTNKHYIIIILLVMLIVSILTFNIYKYNNTLKSKIINSNTIEVNYEINKIDYEEELNKVRNKYNNNDIVGILSNSDDTLNEIVMQSTDNDYYLEHTVYHESNWRGQTFLDYRNDINNSDKLIIYGHNSNYYNLPFKVLENYYNKSYYDENKYLYLQTNLNKYKYEIFSVYVEVSDWDYYNKMKFNTKNEYYNHILKLKNKSMYDTNVLVNKDDKILIIQTCSTKKEYSNYENKFLLIIAKRV
ncbi:MAG: class B sortase [Bacilli bacterium]|nr:class B sortase [Bacilli bacterium]